MLSMTGKCNLADIEVRKIIIIKAVLYDVRNIQRLLQKLGCWVDKNGNRSKANATGYYGETTQASLIKFQKEYMSKSDQSVIRQSVTKEMAQFKYNHRTEVYFSFQ